MNKFDYKLKAIAEEMVDSNLGTADTLASLTAFIRPVLMKACMTSSIKGQEHLDLKRQMLLTGSKMIEVIIRECDNDSNFAELEQLHALMKAVRNGDHS